MKKDEFDPKIIGRLEELRDVPARDPHAAARGRARFIAEAGEILPVSDRGGYRHKSWMTFSRKERLVMNVFLSIVLALAVLFGGSATVAAAQDDLPNQPLYTVKTLSEDIRLWFNGDPQAEIGLLMELVQTRVGEMNTLAGEGITPPAQVEQRLNQHIEQALQIAAGMDDEKMNGALAQLQNTLREQVQIMNQLQAQTSGETSQIMLQTRDILQTRLRLVEEGIADPNGFRNTVRNEGQQRAGQTEMAPHQNQPTDIPVQGGNGEHGASTPQGPNGPNQPTGTPAPGGNGEQSTPQSPGATCTPQCTGTCTPQGTQNGSTPTPDATGNPNPGSNATPQGTGGTGNKP